MRTFQSLILNQQADSVLILERKFIRIFKERYGARPKVKTLIKAFSFGIGKVEKENGGAMRDRTADLLDANQALSQLSYSPISHLDLVGLGRFERPTSPLSGVRSNQLSYRPDA